MDKPLLQLENVSTGYGIIPVLDGINLSVHKGDIYALLGPNGGGKSTLLKVCSRQIDPWTGSVKVAGRSTDGIPAEDLAKIGVCTIPEGKGIFPNLTVDENLIMMTHLVIPNRDKMIMKHLRRTSFWKSKIKREKEMS